MVSKGTLSRHPTDCNIWPFKDPSTEWCSPHNKVGCNFAICYNTIDSNESLLNKFYEAAAVDEDYIGVGDSLEKMVCLPYSGHFGAKKILFLTLSTRKFARKIRFVFFLYNFIICWSFSGNFRQF